MKYVSRTFTLPAANRNTSEVSWDMAFLTREEFIAKYGMSPVEYIDYGGNEQTAK